MTAPWINPSTCAQRSGASLAFRAVATTPEANTAAIALRVGRPNDRAVLDAAAARAREGESNPEEELDGPIVKIADWHPKGSAWGQHVIYVVYAVPGEG